MSINSLSINSESINSSSSSGAIVNETVIESLSLIDISSGTIIPIIKETIVESLAVSDLSSPIGFTPLYDNISFTNLVSGVLGGILLTESLILKDILVSRSITREAVTELIRLLDQLAIGLSASATDNIALSEALSSAILKLNEVRDAISLNDSSNNSAVLVNFLVTSLNLLNSISLDAFQSVVDAIAFSNTVITIYEALGLAIESLVVEDSSSTSNAYIVSLNSSLLLSNSASSNGVLSNQLVDQLFFVIKDKEGDTYSTYLFSPETSSVSTYSNYNFDSSTKFGDKYLFSNNSGLYEYGADTDNLEEIVLNLLFPTMSFGSTNLKSIPQIYLGISNNEEAFLKVRVDGKAEVNYRLNKRTSELQTQKIAIGKGLIGRYFQFELISSATQFNLDSIDFLPIELKRKL
jgi:hypothetical protein